MNLKKIDLEKINIKKTVFAILCVLLAVVVILTCVVAGKFIKMFLGSSGDITIPTTGTNAPTLSTEATDPTDAPTEPTDVPTEPTDAPTEPTDAPTEPTDAPTEPTEEGHVHDYQLTDSVQATCENYGYNIYTCSTCGKQDIPAEEQTAPYGHSFGAGQIIDATCTESGCTRYTCSRCGFIEERNAVEALGHNFQLTETIQATCGTPGYEIHTCTICQATEQRNDTEALEHAYEILEQKEANCMEGGLITYRCANCQDEYTEESAPATGHNFTQWENVDGIMSRSCQFCDLVETEQDLHITHESVNGDFVHDIDGNPYKMYLISIGTEHTEELFQYILSDYIHNGSLAYTFNGATGLTVTYKTTAGEVKTLVLEPWKTASAVIQDPQSDATEPEVTEPEVTEPEVTEPEVTEPEVTEPAVTEPEETQPQATDATE